MAPGLPTTLPKPQTEQLIKDGAIAVGGVLGGGLNEGVFEVLGFLLVVGNALGVLLNEGAVGV